MYLLDTDVVSQATKLQPNGKVMVWLQRVRREELYLSAITIHEVRFGAERMPAGRKQKAVEIWLERDLIGGFAGRILPIDAVVADACGRMVAEAIAKKHTPSLDDALIAATARVHGLKLATLNRSHFEPLRVELVEFG